MEFEKFKKEILARLKRVGACNEEYIQACIAPGCSNLMKVVKDNFHQACCSGIIDHLIFDLYRDMFMGNGIYCNMDASSGFLLVTGNTGVIASGNAKVIAIDSSSVDASEQADVYAHDNAKVMALGRATVTAFNSASVRAYNDATVRASDDATVRAYDNTIVNASDYATVIAFNVSVIALDQVFVRACVDSVSVTAYNNVCVDS
jgi:hypothetical protein